MKLIAYVSLTGDIMDRWYSMRQPDGKRYDWDYVRDAIALCEKEGWQCLWEGKVDCYTPDYFINQQLDLF